MICRLSQTFAAFAPIVKKGVTLGGGERRRVVVLVAAIVAEALPLATPLAEVVAVFVGVVLAQHNVYTHCTMMVHFKRLTSGNLPNDSFSIAPRPGLPRLRLRRAAAAAALDSITPTPEIITV